MFRYDTHVHTLQASACALSTGAELARAYKERGYDGIFITDHFFNGNTSVASDITWKERVELFCKGYEDAFEEGCKIGLDVFFGFEYAVGGADFLVYNIDKKWLLEHEDIDKYSPSNAFSLLREAGGFVVHAHPFRQRDYISHIKLCPEWVDAVEVYNGSHGKDSIFDSRAKWYAQSYNLPLTAGSDTHSVFSMYHAGFVSEKKLTHISEYKSLVTESKIMLFCD
ncbi:MAG: PHP domain-containing protein [Lachnospiraceae bacterium]|nr:PHP domain-containing protein [Lachnospiraceae bacterium]